MGTGPRAAARVARDAQRPPAPYPEPHPRLGEGAGIGEEPSGRTSGTAPRRRYLVQSSLPATPQPKENVTWFRPTFAQLPRPPPLAVDCVPSPPFHFWRFLVTSASRSHDLIDLVERHGAHNYHPLP